MSDNEFEDKDEDKVERSDDEEEDEDAKFAEARLDVGGTNIYFAKAGKGPMNLLFLPDMISSYSIDYQRHLKEWDHKKYTMVAWDAPGYGRSRPPDRDNSPGYHRREAKLAHDLMEKLGLVPYSILAYGDAGPTAMIMAHEHRNTDHVQKLVLWGTSSYVGGKQNYAYNSVVRKVELWADKKKRPYLEVYSEELLQQLWLDHCEAKIEYFKDKKTKGDLCSDLLPEITHPVLLIYPEHDYYYDEEEMDDLEEFLPNCTLIFGEDMYHRMHDMSFDYFKKITNRFLDDPNEETHFDIADEERERLEDEYGGIELDEEWLAKPIHKQKDWRDYADFSIKDVEGMSHFDRWGEEPSWTIDDPPPPPEENK